MEFITDHNRIYMGGLKFNYSDSPKPIEVDSYRFNGKYSCYKMYEVSTRPAEWYLDDEKWGVIVHSNRIIALIRKSYVDAEDVCSLYPFYEASTYERKFAFSFEHDETKMVGQYGCGETMIRVKTAVNKYDMTFNSMTNVWSEIHLLIYLITHARFSIVGHLITFDFQRESDYMYAMDEYERIPRQLSMFA